MTPLGRGLASLIPRRNRNAAEEIIEHIDSMEEVPGNPPAQSSDSVPVDDAVTAKRNLTVHEEVDTGFQHDEQLTRPKKPLVTPISIDPEETDADHVLGEAKSVTVEDSSPKTTTLDIDFETEEKEAPATVPVEEEVVEEDMPDAAEPQDIPKVIKKSVRKGRSSRGVHAKTVSGVRAEQLPAAPVAEVPAVVTGEMDFRLLSNRVESVPVETIEVNPLQPRRVFDKEDLEDLVQSLEQHGMLQPLVVIERLGGGYELVAGERRLRAAKQLGWKEVPCVVRSGVTGDKNRLELALIENVQRQNLNPVEEAMGYQRLHEEYGMTHEDIGQRVGRSRVGITNMLRVLQLPAEIQRGLIENKITVGHARAILMIPDEEKQLRFYNHVLDEGLTVRKAENRARNIQRAMNLNDPLRKKNRGRPQLAMKYDGKLQEKFGFNARVKFDATKNRFEVVFHAYNEEEAVQLVERLLGLQSLPDNVDADVLEE